MYSKFLEDPDCIKQREYVNIPPWHEAGYKGAGIHIFHDDTFDLDHAGCCIDILKVMLPKAKIYSGRIGIATKHHAVSDSIIYCNETDEILPMETFIKKYKINQINNSTTSKQEFPLKAAFMAEMIKKYNLFCTGSAGNDEGAVNNFAGAFILVGGVYFYGNTNEIRCYNPKNLDIDFTMFMGFQMGTSFSAPFLNGMGGLLRCRYGLDMSQEAIYDYFKAHCKSLDENKGKEKGSQYGFGLPVLGNPDESF